MSTLRSHLLTGFTDPVLTPELWARLLSQGPTRQVFLTWEWQTSWWQAFGRGQLLLLLIESHSQPIAVAPLFADEGMLFFVGSGGSDYLDFVGDVSDPEVMTLILRTACEQVPGLLGFHFYHVPDQSPTGAVIQEAAARLSLDCYDEGTLPAPGMSLQPLVPRVSDALQKRSLVRHEKWFRNSGQLKVQHFRDAASILPHLDEFFEQHVQRWSGTESPSLFCRPSERAFYVGLTTAASSAGWLRFTRIDWEQQAIAFHFGFCYEGNYFWYKPTFNLALARRSPGEVLLRQLLLAAVEEGASTFDFGLGDEAFKSRFSTHVNTVRTWGVYPRATGSTILE